ncbi:MAG: AMP-binding protein, partial [Gordonia sp. (in: high G+C Gram-positive bacteria)]
MKIEHRTVIAAPIEDVWEIAADPTVLARFGNSRFQVTADNPDRAAERNARYRVLIHVGAAIVGSEVIITEAERPRELAWSAFTGIAHRVRLRLRQVPGGTAVTLRLSYDVPGIFGSIADFASYPKVWSLLRDVLAGIKDAAEGAANQPPGKRLPQRIADEAVHLSVLARAGIIAPMRPDRLLRIGLAARTWGLGPGTLISVGAARHGDRPMVIEAAGSTSLTYAEGDRQSSALATGLHMLGVTEGDAVALLVRNHRGFVLAMGATAKLGCDLLLLNTGFSGPQIAEVCRREQPSALIYDAEFAELIDEAATNRRRILADGPATAAADGVPSIAALAETYAGAAPASPGRSPKVTILTSGTTGTPKGASRGAISGGGSVPTLEAPAALLDRIPLHTGMRVGLAAPAFHAWGLSNLLLSLALGSTVVCVRTFDAQAWLAAIAEHRIEVFVVVPVMLSRILELPEEVRDRYDTSSLRVVAASGSALPGDLSERWMDAFGENLYNLYGSTEVANAT